MGQQENGATDATGADPLAQLDSQSFSEFSDMVANVYSLRGDLFKRLTDPRRDIDDECGHQRGYVDPYNYQALYDTEEVANRVVQVFPQESWQVSPIIYESEDPEIVTPFEEAWRDLGKGLRHEESYHQDNEGNQVWEYLERIDQLSGIGHYGVLFLGLDDGLPLDKPAAAPPAGTLRKLTYLRCYSQSLATVTAVETDVKSPRYGWPTEYELSVEDFDSSKYAITGAAISKASGIRVHWTRVIHVADNLDGSEIYGVPRMQPVYKRLQDLKKLYGGSAEMYWRGAFPGLSLETHPTLGGDVRVDRTKLRGQMEDYMNGLQRYLALTGMSAKSLAPQVVDPTPQIERQIEAICIKLGIPKRIFMGSERGEQASTQDKKSWGDRLRHRQAKYLTPRLIVPFVDRLINLGVLPKPNGYSVYWNDIDTQTYQEKANVGITRTQSLVQYVTGGVESYISFYDYLTLILGMSEKEAQLIIGNRAKMSKIVATGALPDGTALPGEAVAGPATKGTSLNPATTNPNVESARQATKPVKGVQDIADTTPRKGGRPKKAVPPFVLHS